MPDDEAVIDALYDAFRRKDHAAFEAICHPDLLWVQNPGFPGGATHQGPRAVVSGVFERFDREWSTFRFVRSDRFAAAGRVIVLGAYEGRHRVTGRSFRAAAAHVYTLRDGKVARFDQYTDTHEIQRARG